MRNWGTREANASEEPEVVRGPEGRLASHKINFQNMVQHFGKPDAKPPAVYSIKVGRDLDVNSRSDTQAETPSQG